jgi:transcription antitermination factor NusG
VTQISGALLELATETRSQQSIAAAGVDIAVSSWFAIQTRPKHEKKVASDLQEKGVTAFLPLFSSLHQWSDRRRLVQMPLFPGYVFVRIGGAADSRIPVLRTSGVVNFVGIRGIGVAIPDSQIEAVQAILDQQIPFTPYPYLSVGRQVRIQGGSLDGLQGILVAKNTDHSLIVSVELIQRSLAIRVVGYRVVPV